VLLGIGAVASPRGDLARAVQACAEGAELSRGAGDHATRAHCLLVLGVAQWGLGEVEAAAATHDEGIDLFDGLHHPWGATMTRIVRARTALEQGEVALARDLLDIALDDARTLGDGHLLGLALEQHAQCSLLIGDRASAELAASEALTRHEANGYTEGIVAALHLLGRVHVANPGRSRAFHLRALELGVGMGHATAQCEALEALAALDADEGDVERACLLLVHAARQRERRSLALRPGEADEVQRLRAAVQRAVGPVWESTERLAPLTSLDEIVGRLLA
jgi:ATP/maltotriose-dependent transcriptional regulator MalT